MASQVLSGARNASYTNNTGQNVRLIINYMTNVTSMTWAGVNVTAESTTIGKDIQNITGEFRSAVLGKILDGPRFSQTGTSYSRQVRELKLGDKKVNLEIDATYLAPTLSSSISGTPNLPNGRNITNPPAKDITSVIKYLAQWLGNIGPQGIGSNNIKEGDYFNSFDSPNSANIFYVPTTVSRGGNFPVELMLAPNQSFSAVCGAYNAIVIKEDGT